MAENHEYRRSEPRVPIVSLHALKFTLSNEGQEVGVANISTKGIGLISAKNLNLEAKKNYVGVLSLPDKEFNLKFNVVYNNGITIGCLITDVEPEFAKAINDYFRSELQALKLKANHDVYQAEEGYEVLYYEGQNNCYALLVKKGDSLTRFKLSYFGNIFDWSSEKAISLGQIVSDTEFDVFNDDDTIEVVKPISEVAPETKESVLKYVEAMEFLQDNDKSLIRSQVESL